MLKIICLTLSFLIAIPHTVFAADGLMKYFKLISGYFESQNGNFKIRFKGDIFLYKKMNIRPHPRDVELLNLQVVPRQIRRPEKYYHKETFFLHLTGFNVATILNIVPKPLLWRRFGQSPIILQAIAQQEF
jgi:hypothetical protein